MIQVASITQTIPRRVEMNRNHSVIPRMTTRRPPLRRSLNLSAGAKAAQKLLAELCRKRLRAHSIEMGGAASPTTNKAQDSEMPSEHPMYGDTFFSTFKSMFSGSTKVPFRTRLNFILGGLMELEPSDSSDSHAIPNTTTTAEAATTADSAQVTTTATNEPCNRRKFEVTFSNNLLERYESSVERISLTRDYDSLAVRMPPRTLLFKGSVDVSITTKYNSHWSNNVQITVIPPGRSRSERVCPMYYYSHQQF